jgi:hypothetical protein
MTCLTDIKVRRLMATTTWVRLVRAKSHRKALQVIEIETHVANPSTDIYSIFLPWHLGQDFVIEDRHKAPCEADSKAPAGRTRWQQGLGRISDVTTEVLSHQFPYEMSTVLSPALHVLRYLKVCRQIFQMAAFAEILLPPDFRMNIARSSLRT